MCRVSRERGRGQLVRQARRWQNPGLGADTTSNQFFFIGMHSRNTHSCAHTLTRSQSDFTPHSPNIDIKAITSTITHSANAAAVGPDREAHRRSLSQPHTVINTRWTQMSMGTVTILLGLHTPETPT